MCARRAIFLDRDGTLIQDVGYISKPSDIELLPGVIDALRCLHKEGFLLVLISNQSGVGRGLFTGEMLTRVHEKLIDCLKHQRIYLDGAYYCPHAPWEKCKCRKPLPGMLINAAQDLALDLTRSYMIGDKLSDIESGRRAGCQSILLADNLQYISLYNTLEQRDFSIKIVPTLLDAAHWIVNQEALGKARYVK